MQKLAARPVGRLYLSLALTLLAAWLADGLCGALVSSLINLNLSVDAVSAYLLGLNVVEPLNRSVLLWAGAAAPLAVIALGKGDQARAESLVSASLMALVIVGLIHSFMPLPEMEGVQKEVVPLMEQYVSIRRFGIVFMLLFLAMLLLFTIQGRMGVSLLLVLVHGAAEVGLTFLLVLQGADSPSGVALSAVVADTLAALLGLFFLTRKTSPLRLTLPRLDGRSVFSALLAGLALMGLSMTGSDAVQFLLKQASLQGAPFLAGYMAAINTLLRGSTNLTALLGAAGMPILCWNFGAGDGKRVRSAFAWMLAACSGFALLACLGMCFFGLPMSSVFIPPSSTAAVEAAVACLRTAAPGIALLGLMIPCLMYLMAANRPLCALLGLVGSGLLHHLPQLADWLDLSGALGGLQTLGRIHLMLTLLAVGMTVLTGLRRRGPAAEETE